MVIAMSKMSKLEKVESLLKDIKSNVENTEEEDEKVFYNREKYLSAFDETCDKFGIEIELEEVSKDEVFSDWQEEVNMTASELQKWSKNPCSREASVDPEAVMERNLRLLEKNKSDWTENDVEDAKRTISFISRMKANRPDSPREGPHGCPSEWAISLLNWAYNPFSSVPTPSSEVKEDLDPVGKVSLQEREKEKVNYEFEPVPDHVVYRDRDLAMQRAESLGLNGVHEHVLVLGGEEVTMYMPGGEHMDWARKVSHPRQLKEEMSQTRQASQVVHSNEQERQKDKQEDDEDSSVRVPPVAIHRVDGGKSVQVEDEVEDVLDELWDENED